MHLTTVKTMGLEVVTKEFINNLMRMPKKLDNQKGSLLRKSGHAEKVREASTFHEDLNHRYLK